MLPPGWLPPRCESRTGAAHLRRGTPCQDASGLCWFEDGGGEPLQVLVVSDGHGGSRYDRSAMGSWLACKVAVEEMQRQLTRIRLNQRPDLQAWQRWLAEALPARLLERWRQEVLVHAEAHPRADGAPPSTLPYGATLGVLLLTPRWWGCTGLGDWDLVGIQQDGSGSLLSEEPALPGGGEATFSLCMEGAERHFATRSAVVPVSADQPPFQLLLSSDGIRKSCGSDADFLTLARHLSGLPAADSGAEPSALAQALDHISSLGSGDDVSVAIGRWGSHADAVPPQESRRERGQPTSAARIVQPGQGLVALPPVGAAAGAQDPAGLQEAPGADPPPAAGAGGSQGQSWSTAWLMSRLATAAVAVAAAAAALLTWGPFARWQTAPEEPSPALAGVLQRQADLLCRALPPGTGPGTANRAGAADRGGAASPALQASLHSAITETLKQRRSSFRELQRGALRPEGFLTKPAQDPTGALIAWSAPVSSAARPALLPALELCPELREALRQQWQRAQTPVAADAAEPTGAPQDPNR